MSRPSPPGRVAKSLIHVRLKSCLDREKSSLILARTKKVDVYEDESDAFVISHHQAKEMQVGSRNLGMMDEDGPTGPPCMDRVRSQISMPVSVFIKRFSGAYASIF